MSSMQINQGSFKPPQARRGVETGRKLAQAGKFAAFKPPQARRGVETALGCRARSQNPDVDASASITH